MSKPYMTGMIAKVLEFVSQNNGVRSVDVALKFGISKPYATSTLCALKEDYVTSEPPPDRLWDAHLWYAKKIHEDIWKRTSYEGPCSYYGGLNSGP